MEVIYLFELQQDIKDKVEGVLTEAAQAYSVNLVRAPIITDKFPEEHSVPSTYLRVEDVSIYPHFIRCNCGLRVYLAVESGDVINTDLLNYLESEFSTYLENRNATNHIDYFGSINKVTRSYDREENVVLGIYEFEIKGIEHDE